MAIAVDLVRLAMEGAYDVAILMSADTDLLPALETVYRLRLAHVEVAAWRGANRLRFASTQLPWCHNINTNEYQSLMDLNDYTKH